VRKFSKRKIAATIAITAILVGGGGAAAIAYWSTSGTGTGTGSTGSSTGITVNQTSTVSNLVPGGPSIPLSGTFTNTNSGPVNITSVTASVTAVSGTGCLKADYVIGGTGTPGTTSIPAGTGVGTWSGLNVSLTNTAINQDACKNATITITYAAS
jgi:hypothetical protein